MKNLWTRDAAKATMEKLLEYVNVLIANEEDAADVLDIHASDTDIISEKLSREGYIEVAITLRKSISASDNDCSALLYRDGSGRVQR